MKIASDAVLGLPPRTTVFSGQSADDADGLFWSPKPSMAEGFKKGHRGILGPNPVIRERTVSGEQVAGAFIANSQELEVVLFKVSAHPPEVL